MKFPLPKIRYITPAYDKGVKELFPDSVITHGRSVDMYWITQNMPVSLSGRILEFGGWPADNWRAAHAIWPDLTVTDSFYWLYKRQLDGVPTESEWLKPIVEAGLDHGRLNVETMTYNQEFDGIYSVSVMEHVLDDQAGLNNIFHALKPGGWFTFTVEMNPYVGMDYDHNIFFRVYKQAVLVAALREAGFEVNEEAEPFDDFDEQFRAAIENPHLLKQPYKHFRSAGVAARKPC